MDNSQADSYFILEGFVDYGIVVMPAMAPAAPAFR